MKITATAMGGVPPLMAALCRPPPEAEPAQRHLIGGDAMEQRQRLRHHLVHVVVAVSAETPDEPYNY